MLLTQFFQGFNFKVVTRIKDKAEMEKFPEFWNWSDWRVVKNGEDLWMSLPTGEEKRIGSITVYERIKNPNEKVAEFNLFQRGAVAHVWFLDFANDPMAAYARILKDRKWLYGPKGSAPELKELSVNGKFCGVKIVLIMESGEEEFIVVFKDRKLPPT